LRLNLQVMSRRTLKKDNETKKIKKLILKNSKDISTYNDRLGGVVSISNIRFYDVEYWNKEIEVDVVFKGKIYAQTSVLRGDEWMDSSVLTSEKYKISKIKLNKFFRKRLFNEINNRLSYFNEKMIYEHQIKKVTWV
jgi:hypothetical protein